MASTTAPAAFSFGRHHDNQGSRFAVKSTRKIRMPLNFEIMRRRGPFSVGSISMSSIDVSKEDKPVPMEEVQAAEQSALGEYDQEGGDSLPASTNSAPAGGAPKLDPRRFEEKFAVLNRGIYECRSCGHRFDEAAGDPSYPIPPGLEFYKLPSDWRCPTCGAAKSFFQSKSIEVAGFAQNQQFGFGTNALTAGQKAFLIYGGLALAFALFLSGYFVQ